jgi:hypothetical protein
MMALDMRKPPLLMQSGGFLCMQQAAEDGLSLKGLIS